MRQGQPKRRRSRSQRERGGASVPCPICGGDTKVQVTRRDGTGVLRLRFCLKRHKFKTLEAPESQFSA